MAARLAGHCVNLSFFFSHHRAPEAVQALDPDQLAALQRFAASQQRPSEGGIQDAGTRHQLAALDAADGRHHHAPGEGQDMKTHPPSHQRQNEQRMPSGPPMHPDRARQLHGPPTEAPRPPGPAPALPRKPAADTQAAHVDAHGSGSPPVAAPSRTNAVAGQSATNLRHSPTISAAQGGHPSFVPNESVGDLSQFDLTSFDPTAASSWLRFAQQWHNTYQVSVLLGVVFMGSRVCCSTRNKSIDLLRGTAEASSTWNR